MLATARTPSTAGKPTAGPLATANFERNSRDASNTRNAVIAGGPTTVTHKELKFASNSKNACHSLDASNSRDASNNNSASNKQHQG